MFKLAAIAGLFDNISTAVKIIGGSAVVIGAIIGSIAAGKQVLRTPVAVDSLTAEVRRHEAQTANEANTLKTMLCLQISDRRHSDWTQCLVDNTNGPH